MLFLQLITHLPEKPHHTLWLQIYVWSAGVPACTFFFFSFPDHSFIWRSGPVYGFLVTLAGKTIIAPGLRLFVCVWVHILCISVCGFMDKGCDWLPPQMRSFFNPSQVPLWMLTGKWKNLIFCEYMAHSHTVHILCYTLKQTHIYFKIVSCCDIQYTTSTDV